MTTARTFGRYRVTGTLGAGAMGDVYEAVDEVLGRQVAVKTLKGNQTGLAARILDERFRTEARAIATFAHPGVVQVYDIDLNADPPYLVMERVAGPSLKEQLENGRLSTREVRALGIQIANALAAAHAANVIHRDVKPANILGAGPGQWKLADFGVAHVPDSSLTITGQFVGSPAYAPPEALLRGQSGPEGDIFGLGATLYLAAAGSWPRAEATTGGLLAPVPPLRSIAPDIPEDVAMAIDRAVSVEPADRPTASELAELLASGSTSRPSMPVVAPVGVGVGGVGGAAASGPISTMFVPDDSRPGIPTATPLATVGGTNAPPRKLPWKPIAIGAGVLAVLLLIAAASGSPNDGEPRPAGTMTVPTNPGSPGGSSLSPAAAAEWQGIANAVKRGEYGDARGMLDDWERRYGPTRASRDLASQLDALPSEPREPHKKQKKLKKLKRR